MRNSESAKKAEWKKNSMQNTTPTDTESTTGAKIPVSENGNLPLQQCYFGDTKSFGVVLKIALG